MELGVAAAELESEVEVALWQGNLNFRFNLHSSHSAKGGRRPIYCFTLPEEG